MKKAAPFLALVGAFSQLLIPLGYMVLMIRSHELAAMLKTTTEGPVMMKIMSEMMDGMSGIVNDFLLVVFFALAALLLFILAITAGRYRQPWAFWFACIYGCCLIPLIPIGTPFGIILLVYALSKKAEFLPPQSNRSIPAY